MTDGGARGWGQRLNALYYSAMDEIECLEAAMAELGFEFSYVVDHYYTTDELRKTVL